MTSPIHTAAMCKLGHTAAVFFYFVMLFSEIILHNFVSSLSFFSSSPFTTSKAASGAGFGVFSVFCCLTFAWFTSKDEVTNRLTASSDYGVSIVESFTPPKNWLPGQEINKDVYAVNTGNIDAFVKEDVAAVLNLTYEDVEVNLPATGAVELTLDQVKAIEGQTTEDGFKTYEAGGYLAYAKAKDGTEIDVGSINEGRIQDISTPWTPEKEGVYVFRRAIGKSTDPEPFTYSGYYFVPASGTGDDAKPAKYYKIVLGEDAYPAASRTETTDAVTGETRVDFVYDIFAKASDIVGTANVRNEEFIDQETGEIKTEVGYMFVVEKEAKDQDVTLTLDNSNDRLVAEYTVAYNGEGVYDANATLARAQVDYQNALGKYEAAVASYENAKANEAYAKKLAKAEQELYDAKVALENAYSAVNASSTGAKAEWEAARDAVYNAAKYTDDKSINPQPAGIDDKGIRDITTDNVTTNHNELADGLVALKPVSVGADPTNPLGILPDEVWQAYNGTGLPAENKYVQALNAAGSDFKKSIDNYIRIYKEIYGDVMDGNGGLYKDVTDQLSALETKTANGVETHTEEFANEVKTASATLKTKAAELQNKMAELKAAYANFVDALDLVTGMDTAEELTTPGVTALTEMNTVAEKFSDNADKIDELVDNYVTESKEYREAEQDLADATQDWKDAVTKYNTDVTTAKGDYEAEINRLTNSEATATSGDAWDTNNDKHVAENLSGTLVPSTTGYSAVTTGTDPAFAGATTDDGTVLGKVYNYNGDVATAGTQLPNTVNIRKIDMTDPANGIEDELDTTDAEAKYATKNLIGVTGEGRNADTVEKKTVAQWEEAINGADGYKSKLAEAKNAYDAVKQSASNGKTLKFYIKLVEDWDAYWTMDPDTDKTTNVDFYLNKVLEAGETSHKLIDSVEFDKEVAAGSYKDLTFDLNVGLDSIQVTYDENQRGYTTDAVKADPNFAGMSAAVTAADENGNNVTWTDNAGVPAAPVTP